MAFPSNPIKEIIGDITNTSQWITNVIGISKLELGQVLQAPPQLVDNIVIEIDEPGVKFKMDNPATSDSLAANITLVGRGAFDNQYYKTASGAIYKYDYGENAWKLVNDKKQEVLDSVDFDLRRKNLIGVERNFVTNNKNNKEHGLEYSFLEEEFFVKWTLDNDTTTEFVFSESGTFHIDGNLPDENTVYVYVNDRLYAKFYRGQNGTGIAQNYEGNDPGFSHTRCLFQTSGGGSLGDAAKIVFVQAVGSIVPGFWWVNNKDAGEGVTVRLEVYKTAYQEDIGIGGYVKYEDEIDTNLYKELQIPSTGTFTPYKNSLSYDRIVVLSGLAGDSANFFYGPEPNFYNDNKSLQPCIINVEGIYRMWFAGGGVNYRILHSTSTNGLEWTIPEAVTSLNGSNPGLLNYDGTYDIDNVLSPCVIKDGNKYKMWYQAGGVNNRILYSESTNGMKWSIPKMVIDINLIDYNSNHSMQPFVIKENDVYKMWFVGHDSSNNRRILVAFSDNGVVWSTPILAVDIDNTEYNDTHSESPFVLKENNTYRMWFTGNDGSVDRILFTISTDGVNWDKPSLAIDKDRTLEVYDGKVFSPFIIKEGGIYRVWYAGENGTTNRILYTELNQESKEVISVSNKQRNLPYELHKKPIVIISGYGTGPGVGDGDEWYWHREASGYNSEHSINPFIIKDGSTYKMWFTGDNGTNTRILYSTSTDGVNWITPVLAIDKGAGASPNENGSEDPTVIKDGDTFKMWFVGLDGTNVRTILCSTSTDGITWTTPTIAIDKNVLGTHDSDAVKSPCVIKNGNKYKIWYVGDDGSNTRILYSQSLDGIVWEVPILVLDKNINKVYDINDIDNPFVVKDDNTYKMYYSATTSAVNRILYSISVDGINWEMPRLLLDTRIKDATATISINDLFMLKDEFKNRFYYTGCRADTHDRITYTEFLELDVQVRHDSKRERINLLTTSLSDTQNGISNNLFDDADMEKNNLAISWTVNMFAASAAEVNFGGYSATSSNEDAYIKQNITSIDTTKTYVLSCFVYKDDGGPQVPSSSDIVGLWEGGDVTFDYIYSMGNGWYYCEYRAIPSSASGDFGFAIRENAPPTYYFDNVHFGAEENNSYLEYLDYVNINSNEKYNVSLKVLTNPITKKYGLTLMANDNQIVEEIDMFDEVFMQKISMYGELYKNVLGHFSIEDAKIVLMPLCACSLYWLFKWVDVSKYYSFSDGRSATVSSGSNEKGSWIKFANGTIVQWGKVTKDCEITAAFPIIGGFKSANWDTDLPVPFANTGWSITATPIHEDAFSVNTIVLEDGKFGYFFTSIVSVPGSADRSFYWKAIGH